MRRLAVYAVPWVSVVVGKSKINDRRRGGVKITMNNWVEDERRERLRYVGKSKGEKEKKKKDIYI